MSFRFFSMHLARFWSILVSHEEGGMNEKGRDIKIQGGFLQRREVKRGKPHLMDHVNAQEK